jgi:hypothetical protein
MGDGRARRHASATDDRRDDPARPPAADLAASLSSIRSPRRPLGRTPPATSASAFGGFGRWYLLVAVGWPAREPATTACPSAAFRSPGTVPVAPDGPTRPPGRGLSTGSARSSPQRSARSARPRVARRRAARRGVVDHLRVLGHVDRPEIDTGGRRSARAAPSPTPAGPRCGSGRSGRVAGGRGTGGGPSRAGASASRPTWPFPAARPGPGGRWRPRGPAAGRSRAGAGDGPRGDHGFPRGRPPCRRAGRAGAGNGGSAERQLGSPRPNRRHCRR